MKNGLKSIFLSSFRRRSFSSVLKFSPLVRPNPPNQSMDHWIMSWYHGVHFSSMKMRILFTLELLSPRYDDLIMLPTPQIKSSLISSKLFDLFWLNSPLTYHNQNYFYVWLKLFWFWIKPLHPPHSLQRSTKLKNYSIYKHVV